MQPRFDITRIASVSNVNLSSGQCTLSWLDAYGRERSGVTLAQPYVGRGWGIQCGIENGSVSVVTMDSDITSPYMLSYLQHPNFRRDDSENVLEIAPDEYPYRKIEIGEIILQSKLNSAITLNRNGDIILDTAEGNFIEINKERDEIIQLSAERKIECESGQLITGTIRRDVREKTEREEDAIFGLSAEFGLQFDFDLQKIGVNPEFSQTFPQGLFDAREGTTSLGANRSDMLNPALVEWRMLINEFADSNIGLDDIGLTDKQKAVGKMIQNHLAEVVIGTDVNELGKTLRFDYGFDVGGKGHGSIWSTNDDSTGKSNDGKIDLTNTLRSSKKERSSNFQWTVASLDKAVTATLLKARLHTKGVNHQGKKEGANYRGSLWELQVDKEGLTKWNIPAATSVNNTEPFREGRSLLFNMEGSATVVIGREKATGNQGLDKITGFNVGADFVNTNMFPDYGRRDRSLTLDCEGNIEALIGADDNKGQSLMIEADGSLSLYLGKEVNQIVDDSPITQAAFADNRLDRSLTARLAGNMEIDVGADAENNQSIMIQTVGGNKFIFGKDSSNENSIDVEVEGGIVINISGPNGQQQAINIDATGDINIVVSGDTRIQTSGKTEIISEGQCLVQASNIDLDGGTPLFPVFTVNEPDQITGRPYIGSSKVKASL